MIRDFTQEKKEELYQALEAIDNKDWKSFMMWCGARAADFGEWPGRLGIAFYTEQIDRYQKEVLHTNHITRIQIDAVFEDVSEIDQGYTKIFQEHAEEVNEQIKRVQRMIQAMQSAGRTVSDIGKSLNGMNPQEEISYKEQIENGQKTLESYLKMNGIMKPKEQKRMYDLIMENRPDMLADLYMATQYNGVDVVKEYRSIIDYYHIHKMDITMDDVENLDSFLSLRPDNDERQIQKKTFVKCWNKLRQMGLSEDHIIAVMANIHAESGFSAKNRKDKPGDTRLCDEDYEFKTDDGIAYGIIQWADPGRKEELLKFANKTKGSVYDLEIQLNFFQYEMEEKGYVKEWEGFLETKTLYDATFCFLDDIENPQINNIEERMEFANAIKAWYLGLNLGGES